MVSVNLQNGEIKTVSAEKDTGSNYSKEIAEDAAQYQGLSLDAGEDGAWHTWEKMLCGLQNRSNICEMKSRCLEQIIADVK